jgi:hypothetical protein
MLIVDPSTICNGKYFSLLDIEYIQSDGLDFWSVNGKGKFHPVTGHEGPNGE